MIQSRAQGRTGHSRTIVMFVAQLVEVIVTLVVVVLVTIEVKMKDHYFPAWRATLMELQIFDRHNTQWKPVKFGTVSV